MKCCVKSKTEAQTVLRVLDSLHCLTFDLLDLHSILIEAGAVARTFLKTNLRFKDRTCASLRLKS